MKINDKCKYIVKDTEYDCVILDKKEEFGSSIKNHLLQTMDLTKNIYFKINFNNEEVWVTANFLKKVN